MAKRRSENAVSLFPFLAVLVCTMGALILLLLVTTRRIRQKQQLAVPVEVVKDPAPAIPMTSVVRLRDAERQLAEAVRQYAAQMRLLESESDQLTEAQNDLQMFRELLVDAQARLAHAQSRRQLRAGSAKSAEQAAGHLAGELRRLNDQAIQQKQRLRELRKELSESEKLADAADKLVAQRRSDVELLRQQAAGPREQSEVAATAETVIEFTNPRGTARTPIIIEVDGDGFLFPATGARLRKEDLTGFRINDNPLLTALLVTHRHRSRDMLTSQPYVLLIVRPSGILGFYPAKRVLQQSKIHFGYELAAEDLLVAHAEPAEGEAEAVEQAISNSLSRRNNQLVSTEQIRRRISALRAMQARDGIRPQQPSELAGRYGQPAKQLETPSIDAYPDGSDSTVNIQPSTVPQDHSLGRVPNDAVLAESSEPATGSHSEADQPFEAPGHSDSRQDVMNPGMVVERALQQALAARAAARPAAAAGSGETGPMMSAAESVDTSKVAFGDVGLEPPARDDVASNRSVATTTEDQRFQSQQMRQQFAKVPDVSLYDQSAPAAGERVAATPAETGADGGVDVEFETAAGSDRSPWSGRQMNQSTTSQPVPIPLDGQRFQTRPRTGQSPYQNEYAGAGGTPSANTSTGSPASGGQSGQQGPGVASTTLADQRITYYQPFTVYLDPQFRTVGTEDPQPLHGQSVSFIVRSLIADLTSAERQGPDISWLRSIPAVTFVVSPGAHTLYLQLARELDRAGIPSSSVVSLESHVQEHVEGAGAAFEQWAPNENSEQPRPRINPAAAARELP